MIVIRYTNATNEIDLSGMPVELRAARDRVLEVANGVAEVMIEADPASDPRPYDRCLPGLRVRLGEGPTRITLAEDGFLEAVADVARLSCFASYLDFPDDSPAGYHTHYDSCWGEEWVAADSFPLVISMRKT
jgi:hypothetical protein